MHRATGSTSHGASAASRCRPRCQRWDRITQAWSWVWPRLTGTSSVLVAGTPVAARCPWPPGYVSVASRHGGADLKREEELASPRRAPELAGIYVGRGLDPDWPTGGRSADGSRCAGEPCSRRAGSRTLSARPCSRSRVGRELRRGAAAPCDRRPQPGGPPSGVGGLARAAGRLGWLPHGRGARPWRRGPRGVLGASLADGVGASLRPTLWEARDMEGRFRRPSCHRRRRGESQGPIRAGPSTWRTCCGGTTSASRDGAGLHRLAGAGALWADPTCTVVTATREEEALGILSGAWLGGRRGALYAEQRARQLRQHAGLLNVAAQIPSCS